MTNTQILGTVSLVLGVGLLLQRRGVQADAAATTDVGTGRGVDLWPDLPSVLGTIGDRFNYFISGKQAGNAPEVSRPASALPLNLNPGSPSDYLPLSPLNPENVGLIDQETSPQGGDPNLDPWNTSAYADLAWFKPIGTDFAPAPPGIEDYISPGA